MAAAKPKSPPSVTPTTLDDLRKRRELLVTAPSGAVFKIRPINLERHALSGGLPAKLRDVAQKGAAGVNEVLGADDERVSEEGEGVREYLDRLVAAVLVEPTLPVDEDGTPDPEAVDLLHPNDYRWLVAIAMGEEDFDGEGRRMWGREPLSRFATFRHEHGCSEDCDGCSRVVNRFSAPSGSGD